MALKDWKKTKNPNYDSWENKHEDEWEIRVFDKYVWILEPNESPTRMSKWKEKKFKTKSQALKFAKAYMRKH